MTCAKLCSWRVTGLRLKLNLMSDILDSFRFLMFWLVKGYEMEYGEPVQQWDFVWNLNSRQSYFSSDINP